MNKEKDTTSIILSICLLTKGMLQSPVTSLNFPNHLEISPLI